MNGLTNPNGGVNTFGKRPKREVPGAAPVEAPATDDSQLSKSALKNKKKREAAKKKAEQEKAAGGQKQGGSPQPEGASGEQREPNQAREGRDTRANNLRDRRNDHRSRSRANQDNRRSKSRPNNGREGSNGNGNGNGHHRESSKHLSPANIVTNQPVAEDSLLSPSPEEKKRRALHKKLRAIEDLKMRQASGEKLEDTQVKKIATEAEVRRDLEKLGFNA